MHIPEVEKELILNLKIDETNPNKMTKEQIQSVANSIKKYGFLVPIIVNKDNVIIDGHQRKIAAERLDMLEVPIIRLDVDKIDAKLLKQILNKLKGTHDYEMDLEEYRVILQEQGNLDSLKDLVAFNDKEINEIKHLIGAVDLDSLNDSFELASGAKKGLQQITFTLSDIQMDFIKSKLDNFELISDYEIDNENKNGNKLYGVFVEWAQQKKLL